ncbi:MAG: PIN domain-containing protein [Candidimonas sp.]|nr:MAG: PIN domain-containing protein [Candidimonas sp.]
MTGSRLPDYLVLDTCVLLSGRLRHILLGLGARGCFRPVWSRVIADEWQRNAARVAHVSADEARAWWDEWAHRFPAATELEIEPFKTGLKYSDAKDWHVIAAGLAARHRHAPASVAILTRNTRDFNRPELRRLGLALFDPDRFLVQCLEVCRPVVVALLEALPRGAADTPDAPIGILSGMLRRERLFRLDRLLRGTDPDPSAPISSGAAGSSGARPRDAVAGFFVMNGGGTGRRG